jgi:hypothetical protein
MPRRRVSAQSIARIERAQLLLSQGFPFEIIRRKLSDEFQVNYAAAEKVILEARREWAKQPVNSFEERREQHLKRLELFVCEAMARGDCSSALRGIVEHARFLGIQPTATLRIEQSSVMDMDPDRVREYMARLATRVTAQAALPARAGTTGPPGPTGPQAADKSGQGTN